MYSTYECEHVAMYSSVNTFYLRIKIIVIFRLIKELNQLEKPELLGFWTFSTARYSKN
jgi:hypothetical protein